MAHLVTAIILAGRGFRRTVEPSNPPSLATIQRASANSAEAASGREGEPDEPGKITLARLRWGSDFGGSRRGGFSSAWNHDYPRAEQHLSLITKELTLADIRTDSDIILALDDPKLFDHPIALMWEPGFWNLTDREAESFRVLPLERRLRDLRRLRRSAAMEHVRGADAPRAARRRLVRLEKTHVIFDSFFRIKDIDAILHPMYGLRPSYYGIFEGNDPTRRLMVVANFDNDVPEYWEWSGQGVFPFDTSNEAYKLGVNYVIYGITH